MEADPRAPGMHRSGRRLGRSRLSAAQEGPHFQLSKGDTSFARALLPQSWFPLYRQEVISRSGSWCFPSWGGIQRLEGLEHSLLCPLPRSKLQRPSAGCVQVSEKNVAATDTGGLGNCPNRCEETDLAICLPTCYSQRPSCAGGWGSIIRRR